MQQLLSLEKEKIYQDLWRLSWPVMMFMVFQSTLELVDIFWVAKLGTSAVAALSLSNSLFWMLFAFAEIINTATHSLTARYRGAGEIDGVVSVARHSFWLAAILSALVIVLVFSMGDLFISFYKVAPEVHGPALLYFKVVGISFIFTYAGMALGASLQGVGDTRTPMIILVLTNVINMVLDPILIFGLAGFPALGILGAALATLLARLFGFAMMFYIILSGKISPSGLKVTGLCKEKLRWAYFTRMLQIGLPACLQAMTRPLTGLLMMWIVALFGTEAIASFGIGMRLLGLSFIMISGLTVGTATMVGQSLGAGLKDLTAHIIRKSMVLSTVVQAVMAAACFFGAAWIISFFAGDPAVQKMGTAYLRILAPALLVMGPFHVIAAVFRGSGNSVPPMAGALIANWIIKIPCAFFLALPLGMGTDGVWWAITISVFAELVLVLYWYRHKQWMHREIRIAPQS